MCCQCVGCISGLDVCLGLAGQSCGLQMFGSCLLASCVGAGQGCVHVWCGVCVSIKVGFVFGQCVGWMSGLLAVCLDGPWGLTCPGL